MLRRAGALVVALGLSCSANDLTEGSASPASAGAGATGAGGDTGAGATGGSSSAGGACSGADTCVPSAPAGWEGPFRILAGPSGSGAACGAGYKLAETYDAGDVSGDISCAMCICGASGVHCDSLTVHTYSTGDCTSSSNSLFFGAETCLDAGYPSPFAHSVQSNVPTVSGMTICPSSGGDAAKSPVTWTEEVTVCAPERATQCSEGVCLPPPGDGFPKVGCVTKAGPAECPPEFPVKSTAYSGIADTRACTACDCEPVAGTCTATVQAYLGTGCTSSATNVPADGASCPLYSLGIPGWRSVGVTKSLVGGGCNAVGGQKIGMVAPGDEVTVCCGEL